ncbi:hypothetical protein SAMN05192574_106187 [Mucilaginibacter gossypiicola]|uniref:Dolichyl-phosphate-mannose-protein mannosyltransferase n=1 Tax=Mucilaginibacter gossypiicola TaxID=551995 RepID=A0A1H8N0R3_9SPHI|nr:hypothetical protein [Mucilaginibacter gossypiicola]SEO23187.1 hypothetical protein SAMN05192574_106187 [Mucilaginibacter gossypiicola]
MLKQKLQTHQIILLVMSGIVFIMGIMLIIAPAAIYPDPSKGFQVMRSMELGSAFNIVVKPDQNDISKNTSEFLAWWSPGQYLVPYFFKLIFGVNTGQASSIVTLLFSLSGIFGFYYFFKKAGFTPMISALSVLFIIIQLSFSTPYVFYNGGEVLLFGYTGWFLYGCIAFEKVSWKLAVFIFVAGIIGFICKSSFLWMLAAGCCFLWFRLSLGTKAISGWIKNGLWIGIPAILSLLTISHFYLSKGGNPSTVHGSIKLAWETFGFPLASPILTAFSIDDLTNGLLFHDDPPMFTYFWGVVIVLVCAILSILLIWFIVKKVPYKNYVLLLLVFYVVMVLFFGQSFLRQANISYEARHLRLIGLIVAPGIIYLISGLQTGYKYLFYFVCFVIAYSSYKYFVPSYFQNKNTSAHGYSGIAQLFIDQPSLNYIRNLDRQNTNAIFVVTSPDLSLEIEHNRTITVDEIGPDVAIDYEDYVYKGHAGPLYIVLPSDYIGPKSTIMRKCFPGYKGFKMTMLSNSYILWEAK